jgi:hypothetical protein
MHLSVIYTLVLSLLLMTISALPTTTPPTEPEATPQHPVAAEGSYICCPDEIDLKSSHDFIPLGCKLCTAENPAPPSTIQFKHSYTHPLPLPSEGGEIEGGEIERAEVEAVFSFAGRAVNGLANWKLNWKERRVEQLTRIEQLQMEARRM